MKQHVRRILSSMLRRLATQAQKCSVAWSSPGSAVRPIANVATFLEDIRARGFQCRGLIDVGANTGAWTRMALTVYPNAACLLIEPQEEMVDHLADLRAEHPNVEYVVAGAGSKAGELVQTIYADQRGSTFMVKADGGLISEGKQRPTKIVTLDALVRSRPMSADLVKLDVQGFELEVLKGAQELFGRTEVFILETSLFRYYDGMPMTREIIQFMADRGYEIYDITEYLRRPYDGALGQIDLAFARENGPLRAVKEWSRLAPKVR